MYIEKRPIPEKEKEYFRELGRRFKKKYSVMSKEEKYKLNRFVWKNENKWLKMSRLDWDTEDTETIDFITAAHHEVNFLDFILMYIAVEVGMKNLKKLKKSEYIRPILKKGIDYVIWRNGKHNNTVYPYRTSFD